ncbi:MAG: GNAT family N-acetyltransferase, partial [Rhodoglobus sp.]
MSCIRPAGPHDLPATYRVCLQTSDAGADGSALYSNPDLLGHIYVGPYIVGHPAIAFVLADTEGIAGYVLAASDTRAFEAWQEQHWWPGLRA